ncbi:iron-containing redox enzyme family protein [Cryobacterium sp. TMT1-21]|uniref:iron-containing redox enzyme family protein n=1 Tax=unclassified Cryobacterium TaxID=2649013 RepID=UPI00106C4523|nr:MULTISPECIES: iron-containing redox enzyme family protein [unclassified Cryobacterium]TFC81632.1 iron-containing redox enzyme family protein [Cryobacterium sp. TmT2-59]TFD12509.1 iron-containing redox enzyme family protein [Cryobacterium sp. TMT4-10]TFD13300.1 iron-containing redox enzyme family protein [Cryobacterium sp. TMT1-21]TFD16709.1 iron-containing redox enzyme family protein [Cryobacterium sp. TMT2-23]TFD37673.1 iron-containing redox enzyme family protein [Cryobacterium sp. TMT2-10
MLPIDTNTLTRASFCARGPLSDLLLTALDGPLTPGQALLTDFETAVAAAIDCSGFVMVDDDLQLTLFVLYGLHYGGVVPGDEKWEWHPSTIAARILIENALEAQLRHSVAQPPLPAPTRDTVARALFVLTCNDQGPSLARYLSRQATREQAIEFVVHRSVYTLKEADPHSWAIPRLTGRAKAALIEIQADEYGGGDVERMHSVLFASTMRGLGLDDRYAAYVDSVPAITLASFNTMSMFGLNRRLRGALVGHLAAFEMTSAIPSRLYADGFQRLGFESDVTRYFDEHVEADAVHEQIAGRDLAGSLAEDDPALLGDIMFGASVCLTMDGLVADHMLGRWKDDLSSLRFPAVGVAHLSAVAAP